jgi:hypothetical protein
VPRKKKNEQTPDSDDSERDLDEEVDPKQQPQKPDDELDSALAALVGLSGALPESIRGQPGMQPDDEVDNSSDDESDLELDAEQDTTASIPPIPHKAGPLVLPKSYEIEFRTRVRFPAPEILAAATQIGERVAALEADLVAIKDLVTFVQDRIARGFDISESSSAMFASGEGETTLDVTAPKKTEPGEKKEVVEELDDVFLTLL